MNDFQRARQPEQKEERRLHLLATARAYLLAGGDARTMSLNELARQAEMAKSNVYRYFESREAVLLALLWAEWGEWFVMFGETWEKKTTFPVSVEVLSRHLAKTLAQRPLLGQLTTLLPSVLEHNLSEELIVEFKLGSLQFFRQIAAYLHDKCEALSVDEHAALLLDIVTVIAGLHPFSHPSETVLRAHAHEGLAPMRHDYERDLERMVLALARVHASR